MRIVNIFGYCLLFWATSLSNLPGQQVSDMIREAHALRAKGDCGEAILLLSQIIEQDTSHAQVYAMRALCLSRLKNFAQALPDYDRAVFLGSQDPLVFLNRGWAHFNLGKRTEACQDWWLADDLGYSGAQLIREQYCQP